MKLSSIFKKVASAVRSAAVRSTPAPATQKPAPAVVRDGFDGVKKPARVDLSSRTGSDVDYVRGLYRELLGREPDPVGMANHLKGLKAGASRDDVRSVFLSSTEYRMKGLGGTSPFRLKAQEDPGTVAYVNTPQNKNIAPRSSFMGAVNEAIDRVQARGVGVDPADTNRITNFDAYHQAVCEELLKAGYKAHYDGEEMAVSRVGDDHSEQFDISTWKGEVRRFYASWQQPSAFEN